MILGKRYPYCRRWNLHVKRKRHNHDSLSLCALLCLSFSVKQTQPLPVSNASNVVNAVTPVYKFCNVFTVNEESSTVTFVEFAQQRVKYRGWYLYFKKVTGYAHCKFIHTSSHYPFVIHYTPPQSKPLQSRRCDFPYFTHLGFADTLTLSSFKNRLTFISLVQYYSRFQ